MEPFTPPVATQAWWDTILGTGLFAKIILVVLFFFSVISWAIIIRKLFLFHAVRRENRILLSLFQHRRSAQQFHKAVADYKNSPLAKVLASGLQEWANLKKLSLANPEIHSETKLPANYSRLAAVLPNVQEAMNRTGSVELERIERFLPFLATVSSVSPFLGLLGTVWGVLSALINVKAIPVVTLQVIAPGVSDALVTTVAGLLVAIPALMFYNYFVGKVRDLTSEVERFISEVLSDFRKEMVLSEEIRH
ncbi:MAG: MotA/TolQ/ExbB proton channel family protein [candidate division WOR-3 bacterium]